MDSQRRSSFSSNEARKAVLQKAVDLAKQNLDAAKALLTATPATAEQVQQVTTGVKEGQSGVQSVLDQLTGYTSPQDDSTLGTVSTTYLETLKASQKVERDKLIAVRDAALVAAQNARPRGKLEKINAANAASAAVDAYDVQALAAQKALIKANVNPVVQDAILNAIIAGNPSSAQETKESIALGYIVPATVQEAVALKATIAAAALKAKEPQQLTQNNAASQAKKAQDLLDTFGANQGAKSMSGPFQTVYSV